MDELMDLLVKDDANASQISDKIKDILFAKSAQEIETIRPNVAASVFDDPTTETDEVVNEYEIEPEEDEEEETQTEDQD
jgi:hypothetical protein